MRKVAKYTAMVTLVGILLVSVMFLTGKLESSMLKGWLLGLTALWFVTAAYWMQEKKA
jgi:hypothetical protein